MCEYFLLKLLDDVLKIKGFIKFFCLGEVMFVEICINIDVVDGMINGILCIIKKLDYCVLNLIRCSIVWVEFCFLDIGKKCRKQF